MDISQIQSQLAINRSSINRLHNYIYLVKYDLRYGVSNRGVIPDRVRELRTYSKRIAKLVVLQKALKKDLSYLIHAERLYKVATKSDTLLAEICKEVILNRKDRDVI